MKKKMFLPYGSHNEPPFADNYAGFFGIFPGIVASARRNL